MIDIVTYSSPVGTLLLGATSAHLVLCDWLNKEGNPRQEVINRLQKHIGLPFNKECTTHRSITAILKETVYQLNEYFQGTRQVFDIPIKTFGTTFQQNVWKQLQTIPYGVTMTYKEQAEAIGRPKAVRAVANITRLNAISIIIPCHRVIGTNNTLYGYAGGLDAKHWLLQHELRCK